jgi:large subunit ribosomal protein L17
MRKLSRYSEHRISLLRNLSISLAKYKLIATTLGKARTFRPFFEKLVTLAKKDSLHARRLLLARLFNNKEAVNDFIEVAKKNQDRNGGYIRILKFDNSQKAIVQIVEYSDEQTSEKTE